MTVNVRGFRSVVNSMMERKRNGLSRQWIGALSPLKLPFALREDYGGNTYSVAPDLSSVVFSRPGG